MIKKHISLTPNYFFDEMSTPYERKIENDLVKGHLDLIILRILAANPMHGWAVIEEIRNNFGAYFEKSKVNRPKVHNPSIYKSLKDLGKKGYLESKWDIANGRPKKIYELTDKGKELLEFAENTRENIQKKLRNYGKIEPETTEIIAIGAEQRTRYQEN